jgi:hypothetical protein
MKIDSDGIIGCWCGFVVVVFMVAFVIACVKIGFGIIGWVISP